MVHPRRSYRTQLQVVPRLLTKRLGARVRVPPGLNPYSDLVSAPSLSTPPATAWRWRRGVSGSVAIPAIVEVLCSTQAVTDSSAFRVPGQQPLGCGVRHPPGAVYAAVVVTWIAATVTAAFAVVFTASLLWLAAPLFETFDFGTHNPRWFVLGFGLAVVLLCVLADVVAYFVLHAHRWAHWALISLCVVAALAGVMTSYYIAPLLVTAVAVGVGVMLLMPTARAWFHTSRTP
jgi:hypothetical protein